MAREKKVVRPIKRSEYTIEFATIHAQKGWTDLCATIRNPLRRRVGLSHSDAVGADADQLPAQG